MYFVGGDSVIGIATGYWDERSGDRIPVGEKFFASVQIPLPVQWLPGLFLGGKARGMALTTHANLAPRLKKK